MSDPKRQRTAATDAPALDFGATAPSSSAERAERTLVLIGMRGAGKTHLGRSAAAAHSFAVRAPPKPFAPSLAAAARWPASYAASRAEAEAVESMQQSSGWP